MRFRTTITTVLALLVGGAAPAGAQEILTAPLPSHQAPAPVDSGLVRNDGKEPAVVFSTEVHVPDATWLRLQFDQVLLAGDPERGDGSYLLITSLLDGASQYLNAEHVAQWRNTSAYMNGDRVRIDLVAYPGTGDNRLVMTEVTAGDPALPGRTICDSVDDRLPSEDPRAARALPVGCTAWIIDDCGRCFLTAGHCWTSPGSSTRIDVVQFNVPLSNSNGSLNHPPPEDQYATDVSSLQSNGGQGTGNDWAYFGTFPNSNTGLTAAEAQGDWYELATPPNVSGQQIRITGYGTTSPPAPREWNQVQKTHVGPYWARVGTRLEYRTDTTGGNSGSPVILENTGQAIGIHTHGGCGSGGGANVGTGSDHAGLQAALANPRGVCVCPGLEFTYPNGRPDLLDPAGGTTMAVVVGAAGDNTPQPNSAMLHVDWGTGFVAIPMKHLGSNVYEAVFPSVSCPSPVRYYVSAMTTTGETYSDPFNAPTASFEAMAADGVNLVAAYDFESAPGWTVQNQNLATGAWVRGIPVDPRGPSSDQDGSGQCWVTGNTSNQDVDGGPTRLISPAFDLSGTVDPVLSYARYFTTDDGNDVLVVDISANDGASWVPVESVSNAAGWIVRSVRVRDFVTPSSQVRVRFSVADQPNDSVTEAAIDRFRIEDFVCDTGCAADFDGDGDLTPADFSAFRAAFLAGDAAADFDGDGDLTAADFSAFRAAFLAGCP